MKLYYSISEVAELLSVNTSLIRYWEKEFPQLKPNKIANGERRFTQKDIDLLKQIQTLLKDQGYTIEGARKSLKNEGLGQIPDNKLQEVEKKLMDMKEQMMVLKNKLDNN
ncbi:MAG TPA: MerR family transcriptional regulator [Saprospiraceae bacterium]|nr:MerR family transcriptional regulator [Saprospiraceae bacterium]HRG19418.1 MerR family transcriptional regulator [Saprospiraceae bacterium]HRG65585.1 MerR family transcriptional regulator [Saprospiraceae bacterium]